MIGDDGFDEAAAAGNARLDHLYTHEFKNGEGKFFNVITEDDGSTTVEYGAPFRTRNRIKLTVTFLRDNGGQISQVTLKKYMHRTSKGVERWEQQGETMEFRHLTFAKLLGFLKLLAEHGDLSSVKERRIALREIIGEEAHTEPNDKIRELLQRSDGLAILEEFLRNGSVTSRDLVNIGYRKKQLQIFGALLRDPNRLSTYGEENGVTSKQPEKIWQHFFKVNEWIFGLGLDYRYLSILQSEAHVSDDDLAGRDGAIVDFLTGATNFTVLVELKRPDTDLFDERKNRAGSWRLSVELIDAVSQILEQKAGWQIKSDRNSAHFTDAGAKITQKTVDPKSILIIGSDSQFTGTDKVQAIKRKTFELFRRDSRNIEILTYDELYERAKFVIGHIEQEASDAQPT